MPNETNIKGAPGELRRRAEASLRGQKKRKRPKAEARKSEADSVRMLHELEVHQIELELQNIELQKARNELERTVDKYADLYDFAPMGYFSINGSASIMEANLTGSALLGVERSRLINQPLSRFVAPASHPHFLAFLKRLSAEGGKQVSEVLMKKGASTFWASLHGVSAIQGSPGGWFRVAISDITPLKLAEEARRRMEVLAVANRELRREIVRRRKLEKALTRSEHHSRKLLKQSRQMQQQLRMLSRLLLSAQEEERLRISRELHDVVAQTLMAISVRLATLKKEAEFDAGGIERYITRTQQLMEESVRIVHRFALELRPTALDDVGLMAALDAFIKGFREQTGIRVSLSAFPAVDQATGGNRTVLFRVAQEAFTNVARHAHASRVDVTIEKRVGAVRMSIKDNGKGFQESALHAGKGNRLGLLGMRERLDMVGGTFSIKSTPGKGTVVLAQIPLTDRPRRAARIGSSKTTGL